jgi:type III restriction enzyme
MDDSFFERPILNSPYDHPARHWELDEDGQPTNRLIENRRRSDLITPVPKPQRRRRSSSQREMVLDTGDGLSTAEQEYNPTPIINEIRSYVETWRNLPNPDQWQVTPETARLLRHWRHHQFADIRPFFCQIEAVETAIWLAEVAPQRGASVAKFWAHLRAANKQANPELLRIALKLATGAGKTTVMAMLIAWQAVNAVRHPQSRQFSRAFLVVTPGITIRDRLRVLLPNDPDSYFKHRELVPNDMLGDIDRAKIVITNFHSFKRRERDETSRVNRSLRQGRGPALNTTETEGEMLRRAVGDLMGLKNIAIARSRSPTTAKSSRVKTKKKRKETMRPRGCGSPVSRASSASSVSPRCMTSRRRHSSCAVPVISKAPCFPGRSATSR